MEKPRATPDIELPEGIEWFRRDQVNEDIQAFVDPWEGIAYWVEDMEDLTAEGNYNTHLAFFPDRHVLEEWEGNLDDHTRERHIFSIAVLHDDTCATCYDPSTSQGDPENIP